jgi:hypothetical protein
MWHVTILILELLSLCGREKHGGPPGETEMQVLLKSTESAGDTRCSVCGQGFAMFWERQTKAERAEALREIESTLRHHHHAGPGHDVHPVKGFLIPAWDGPIAFSGAAILGNAPVWAL